MHIGKILIIKMKTNNAKTNGIQLHQEQQYKYEILILSSNKKIKETNGIYWFELGGSLTSINL